MPSSAENQHLGTSHSNCRTAKTKSETYHEYTTATGKRDERSMGRFIRNHAGERGESDSTCARVYKAVLVLLDSVVELRKGVSEVPVFSSTVSERSSAVTARESSAGVFVSGP